MNKKQFIRKYAEYANLKIWESERVLKSLSELITDMVASGDIALEENVVIDDMTEEELVELLYSSGLDKETVKLILSTTKAYFDSSIPPSLPHGKSSSEHPIGRPL